MSKTQRKGLGVTKLDSCGVCCRCRNPIPKVKDEIAEHSQLLPELVDMVTGFYECPKPYIGYVMLHPPTRRRNHVVCLECHAAMVDEKLNNYQTITVCPERNCCRRVDIIEVEQNKVDDYNNPRWFGDYGY